MKINFKILLSVIFVSGILWSCSDDSESFDPDAPRDLVVEATITDEIGNVEIVAVAENTVEYEFNLGDDSDIVTNSTGTLNHKYEATGSYPVEVKAYGPTGKFLRKRFTLVIDVGINPNGYTTPLSYPGRTLAWNDEFDGTELSSDWEHELGDGCQNGPNLCGWGNGELQWYQPENTTVEQGYLIIEAKRESQGGRSYTSSRIRTKGEQSFQYGRVDVRATLPKTKGMWPAVWMLGANIDDVGWPWCGEIDIMEMAGGVDNRSIGNLFWENGNGTNAANFPGYYNLSNGVFADEFHVFSIVWSANSIIWYVDDQQFHAITIVGSEFDEFRNDFYFLINLAVGGSLPGPPNSSTRFPQRLIVDYIRIFQDT